MNHLLERFLYDRSDLTPDELAELTEWLKTHPVVAAEARALIQLDELLSRRLAADRGHFLERVATRLATANEKSFVRRVTNRPRLTLRPPRRRQAWILALASAAALLLIVVGWSWFPQAPYATTVAVSGVATVGDRRLQPGMELHAGERLTVGDGTVALSWPDGTQVELASGSQLMLSKIQPKYLWLETGTLTADVTPQPLAAGMRVNTRDAVATVLGTRLRVSVSRSTRLDVLEGKVAFSDRTATVEVGANEMAVSGANQPLRSFARTQTIAFGREGRKLPPDTRSDQGDLFTEDRGYGWERPNDGRPLPGIVWRGRPQTGDRVVMPPMAAVDPLLRSGLALGWAGHSEQWRMAVPDGTYDVTICVGGTEVEQGPHRAIVQGSVVIDQLLTAPGQIAEATTRVIVRDGWLRAEFGGSTAQPAADGSSDMTLFYLRVRVVDR